MATSKGQKLLLIAPVWKLQPILVQDLLASAEGIVLKIWLLSFCRLGTLEKTPTFFSFIADFPDNFSISDHLHCGLGRLKQHLGFQWFPDLEVSCRHIRSLWSLATCMGLWKFSNTQVWNAQKLCSNSQLKAFLLHFPVASSFRRKDLFGLGIFCASDFADSLDSEEE